MRPRGVALNRPILLNFEIACNVTESLTSVFTVPLVCPAPMVAISCVGFTPPRGEKRLRRSDYSGRLGTVA